jgi:hypothetical protein
VGLRGGAVGGVTALQAGMSQDLFPTGNGHFLPHYDPEVESASKIKEHQGYLLGGEGGQ